MQGGVHRGGEGVQEGVHRGYTTQGWHNQGWCNTWPEAPYGCRQQGEDGVKERLGEGDACGGGRGREDR